MQFARYFVSVGLIQLLVMAVSLLRAKLLSQALGPAGMGIFGLLDQGAQLAGQASALGIPFLAMTLMSDAHSESPQAYAETFRRFLRVLATGTLLFTAVALLVLQSQPTLLPVSIRPHRTAALLAIAGAPVIVLSAFVANAVAATGRATSAATITLIAAFGPAVGLVVGALHNGVTGAFAGSLLVGWPLVVLLIAGLLRRAPVTAASAALHEPAPWLTASLFIYVTMVAYTATMFLLRLLVTSRLGAVDAGLLQAQIGTALTVGAVLAPVNMLSLAPFLNRRIAIEDKTSAMVGFLRLALPLFLCGTLLPAWFPALTMRLLFTQEFAHGAASLTVFLAWQLVQQGVGVLQQYLIGCGQLRRCSIGIVAGYAVTLSITGPLSATYGLTGVALALLGGALFTGAILLWFTRTLLKQSVPVQLIGAFLFTAALLLLLFVAQPIRRGLDHSPLSGVVLAVLTGAAAALLRPVLPELLGLLRRRATTRVA